jgi:regulatory protein
MQIKPPRKLAADELWEYALRTLSRRALSAAELRTRLNRRAINHADIPDIIQRLQESRLLDDERFAESFAHSRRDVQGLGRMRTLRDLQARRVQPSLAQQAVEEAYRESDETQLIEAFLERKYRGKHLPTLLSDPRELAAAYRKLRYAGFSSSRSIQALKRHSTQADELEGMEDGEALPTDTPDA